MFLVSKHHRNIIYYKARVHLISEASRTYLSILWWIIDPIIQMAIFYIVFGVLLERGTENFVVFLLIGLISWQWFANSINHAMGSIDGNRSLISQISFPKIILPSVTLVMDCFKFAIVLVMLIGFITFYGIPPTEHYLALPLILLAQHLINCAAANFSALLVPFIPDVKMIVRLVLRAGLFLSGIFYDYHTLPEKVQVYFEFNPLAQLIDAYRSVLLHNQWPDFQTLGFLAASGLLLVFLSSALLKHYDHKLPRILAQQ
jgi:lipopolysaccharide transport system permease protein